MTKARFFKATIILIALVELAAILLFGAFALSGDDLGIAQAMLTVLLGPFAVTTVPALVLTVRDRLLPSFLFIALSIPLMWLTWFLA